MSLVETLTEARQRAADKLNEALAGDYSKAIEFKPNFNGANGADRVSYVRELREMIRDLTDQITTTQDDEDGPVCNERRVVPT